MPAPLPGAQIYELDGDDLTDREWADLDPVQDWQAFFDDPRRVLKHLLDDREASRSSRA